jgi:hypothetical protein
MQVQTIPERLLFTTVRIETEGPNGRGAGTGFFFNYTWGEKVSLFVVTNKHVLQDATVARFFLTKGKDGQPQLGQRFDVELENLPSQWFGHPNADVDVAIVPAQALFDEIRKGTEVFFKAVSPKEIPSPAETSELDALEDVIFVGYPNGIYDTVNLLPILRRGTTATPVSVDYDGRPVFLIDASVFPCSSGSPVFIYTSSGRMTRDGNFNIGQPRLFFIGLVASVAIQHDEGMIDFVDIPTKVIPVVRSRQMLDLGIVFKSRTVVETCELVLRNANLL